MEFEQQLVSSSLLALILESDPRGRAWSCTATQCCSFIRVTITKIKITKLILKAVFDFSRNLASPKITRYMVCHVLPSPINSGSQFYSEFRHLLAWLALTIVIFRSWSTVECELITFFHIMLLEYLTGADLGFLEWWGCNRAKILGHAHLTKTTLILITSRYPALSLNYELQQVQNLRLHHS